MLLSHLVVICIVIDVFVVIELGHLIWNIFQQFSCPLFKVNFLAFILCVVIKSVCLSFSFVVFLNCFFHFSKISKFLSRSNIYNNNGQCKGKGLFDLLIALLHVISINISLGNHQQNVVLLIPLSINLVFSKSVKLSNNVCKISWSAKSNSVYNVFVVFNASRNSLDLWTENVTVQSKAT